MKPTLKLTLFIAFISLFSPQRSFAIAERDTVPTVQKVTRTPEESLKSSKKSAIALGLVFLVPTTLLASTFNGFKKALVFSLVKGAAAASLGLVLICLVSFFVYLIKLKKKDYTMKRYKFWERLMVVVILGIGLISFLPVLYFSLPTMGGLTILLKAFNFLSGLLFSAMGISFLFNKKYKA